jgi:hypothetical protein
LNGCDERNPDWKGQIKEAYSDANKLVHFEGVKAKIDFNSAASFEFLGPSANNANKQSQIQNVFASVATVYEGASWYTPNWIRVNTLWNLQQT